MLSEMGIYYVTTPDKVFSQVHCLVRFFHPVMWTIDQNSCTVLVMFVKNEHSTNISVVAI